MSRTWLFVILSIVTLQAADKPKAKFVAGPASSYPCRQTTDNVTVAAQPFDHEPLAERAFGKVDPYQHGVLPVLVVIQNDTDKTLSMDSLKVELVTANRDRVEATPAADVKYLSGAPRPTYSSGPIPGRAPRVSRRKNPLDTWEIEGRAFAAKMLPPKESANGFFYFQAPLRKGARLLLSGLREAATAKELFFFEIPLD